MVATVPREMQTMPDPSELSRRHFVVQDWTALQTRRRKARAAVLAMVSALLCAFAVAILVYRLGRPRLGERTGLEPQASAGALHDAPPPPAETTIVAVPTLAPPAPSAPRRMYPASTSVYPAASSVRPARGTTTKSPRH